MSQHNIQTELEQGRFQSTATKTAKLFNAPEGYMFGFGNTVPTDADTGWAPGAIFIDTNAAEGALVYRNVGSVASCNFALLTPKISPEGASPVTVAAGDTGTAFFGTIADVVYNLPATAAGLHYKFVTGVASSGTGTRISPATVDQIIGLGITPADNKDLINTGATDAAGDYIELIGDGSVGWYVVGSRGTWAREA